MMKIRLSRRYRRLMLYLLPLTAGVGTLWLWVRAQNWPSEVSDRGIRLRNGRMITWRKIHRINVIEHQSGDEHGISRLDLETYDGIRPIEMKCFEDKREVAQAIRDGFSAFRQKSSYGAAQPIEAGLKQAPFVHTGSL